MIERIKPNLQTLLCLASFSLFIFPNFAFAEKIDLREIEPTPKYNSISDPENQNAHSTQAFQGHTPSKLNNFSLQFGLNFFDAFGLQGRYAYPVLRNGLLPDLSNSLYIEGGFGLTFYGEKKGYGTVTGFNANAAARWDFFLYDEITLFGLLGLGYNGVSENAADAVKGARFFPLIGTGALLNLVPEVALRFDLSYPFLHLGLLYRF